MPRKAPERPSRTFEPEVFLRSINLPFDAEYPERISHFQPTAKTVALAKALLQPQEQATACFVVAPYGSGKSITASFVLQLVENRAEAQQLLGDLEGRLQDVSPEMAEQVQSRRKRKQHGLTLALYGHCPSLPEALKSAALAALGRQKLGRQARSIERLEARTIEDAFSILDVLQEKAAASGQDRILIVWDEFGRHVEALIHNARAAELDEIQLLAEYVSRASVVPITLGLLLHQALLRYAGNLPQSLRAEWKKIDGRFQTLQFVDESREIYRLIGEIVHSRRNGERLADKRAQSAADEAKKVGLFPQLSRQELGSLLQKAYPLEPATLYLLPRLSARVAQNERTLFSFLFSTDLEGDIGPEQLYDYFSGEMRADVAAGGTYRQYQETESALSKINGDQQLARALKAACLLGLGLSGERARASREALAYATDGYTAQESDPVEELIEQKLLLYRKHADQVAVWHGTDVDLRGRVEEEKRLRADDFKLVRFLSRHAPPPYWRPLRYNDDFHLRRFFSSEYCDSNALDAFLGKELTPEALPLGCDGKVIYIVPGGSEDLAGLRSKVQRELHHPRVVVVLPRQELEIRQTALELWCLLQLKQDGGLTGSDPLVESELDQMADDARDHLQRLLDRFVTPSVEGSEWFYRGKSLGLSGVRELRSHLSQVMRRVYPQTPKLNNELIVKHNPSSVIVNARKRLILGILERTDDEEFGLTGNGPDKSMYYTLLLNTGLFREENDGRWARPDEIDNDEGLSAVWGKLREFLTEPSTEPKEVAELLAELQAPPYGVRRGVLPILVAAAHKAFPSIRALVRNGEYVEDILASHIEALCSEPEAHQLLVQEVDRDRERYLRGLLDLFQGELDDEQSGDLIRQCYDALMAWREDLPPGALTTRELGPRAAALQGLLNDPGNPLELFFRRLPEVVGVESEEVDELIGGIQEARDELLLVESRYQEAAAVAVREALRLGPHGKGSLRSAAGRWANCFPGDFRESLASAEARGLLTRLTFPYENDVDLLGSLASLLLGRAFNRWEDSTVSAFEQKLRSVVQQIESEVLSGKAAIAGGDEAVEGLVALVTGRLENQVDQLAGLVGTDRTRALITQIMDELLREKS